MAVTTDVLIADVGDIVTAPFVFTDASGAFADPTTVTAKVRAPDGTITSYTYNPGGIVRDSLGHFHVDIPCTAAGDWYYDGTGTGAVTATVPGTFTVRDDITVTGAISATALTTVSAARAHILRDVQNGSQDAVFALYIDSYSTAITNYCRREFHSTVGATRVFPYNGSGVLNLAPYELRTLTSLKLYTDSPAGQEQTLGSTEYRLEPVGRTPEGTYLAVNMILPARPQARYGFEWQATIVGDWGMAAVPADVELATLIAVDDAYRNPGGFQNTVIGGVSVSEPIGGPSGSLPAGALKLLIPYRRRARLQTLSFARPPLSGLFPNQVP